MELKGLNIVIISNEGWGDVWYSKHNYAYELSKFNQVLFIDPPPPWSFQWPMACRISINQVMDNLRVLRYNNVLPSFIQASYRMNNAWVSHAIGKFLQARKWPVDLVLTFDPARLHNPALLGAKGSLFIAVDKYILSLRGEPDLYRNVDGIVAISRSFNEFYQPYGKPILNIGHGISNEEFTAPALNHPYGDFALYIGGIDKRVDLSLTMRLVEDHPEVPFVFIGAFKLKGNVLAEELFLHRKYKNVHLLGVKPFKELKTWIAASCFCLAPMDISIPGNDISHHKVLQYLAFGKPVFSTVFSEYKNMEHLLYMNNNPAELSGLLSSFLGTTELEALVQARIVMARKHSYRSILAQIGDFLGKAAPTLSIGR